MKPKPLDPSAIVPDFPPEEIARRRDAGIKRALETPPKSNRDYVGTAGKPRGNKARKRR